MAQSVIWTSAMVDQTIEKLRYGMEVDMGCFYKNDVELKDGGILFKHNSNELDEFEKCSDDIVYFVEKYCKFLTDKGRAVVELRKFQTQILNELGEADHYDEEIEEWIPKYRDYILMASRQTGKCFSYNTKIILKNKNTEEVQEISVGDLYRIMFKQHNPSIKAKIIHNIKYFLYKIYDKLDK